MNHPLPGGIYPMLYAFFRDNGDLRTDPFLQQVDITLASNATGIAILGLATEVSKLTVEERCQTVHQVASRINSKKPLLVTVYGNSPAEQISFATKALDLGADALILQPPANNLSDTALKRFFSEIINSMDCPVGIQNAPEFLGFGLSDSSLIALANEHSNFTLAKLECTSVALQPVAQALSTKAMVFNGRCGLELPDNLRAGASGLIPGFEAVDKTSDIYSSYTSGDTINADQKYQTLLPALCFMMQGIPHLLTYGKMLAATRMGIAIGGVRQPALAATDFGIACIERFANQLGPFDC